MIGSHTIPFSVPNLMARFRRGRRMQVEGEKISIFDQYLSLSGKRYKIVLWNANRYSHAIYDGAISNDLE